MFGAGLLSASQDWTSPKNFRRIWMFLFLFRALDRFWSCPRKLNHLFSSKDQSLILNLIQNFLSKYLHLPKYIFLSHEAYRKRMNHYTYLRWEIILVLFRVSKNLWIILYILILLNEKNSPLHFVCYRSTALHSNLLLETSRLRIHFFCRSSTLHRIFSHFPTQIFLFHVFFPEDILQYTFHLYSFRSPSF